MVHHAARAIWATQHASAWWGLHRGGGARRSPPSAGDSGGCSGELRSTIKSDAGRHSTAELRHQGKVMSRVKPPTASCPPSQKQKQRLRTQTCGATPEEEEEASEKAAAIARLCRSENALFELLVQEKTGGDKNKKFVSDFKTLADVLIQEVIKHDVGVKFPVLVGHIHGEENSKFTNGLGESETVRVCASVADTAVLLTRILDGNARAGQLLAHAVHVEPEIMVDHRIRGLRLDEPPNNLAIWVDPIDSTNQYIQGGYNMSEHTRPHSQGLPCVTVLIGVYERIGGLPVMGVVNQPFVHYDGENGRWSGNVFWGVCCNGEQASSLSPPDSTSPADTFSLVLSSSEDRAFRSTLEEAFGPDNIYLAAGAGYKELCVAKGLASVFVSSEDGGTYMWDSCGPHALLRALGGGIVRLKSCLEDYRHKGPSALASTPQIRYHKPLLSREGAQQWANEGGLVAYSSDKSLCAVIEALAQACGPDDTTTDKL